MPSKYGTDSRGKFASLPRENQANFLRRGEAAWQDYLRSGRSVSPVEVLARLQAALDARRSTLLEGDKEANV